MQDRERQALDAFETLTKQMTVGVSRCSRDFRYLWANQVYADWILRPLAEIVDRPMLEVLGKAAFEALRPHFDRVLTGQSVHYEQQTNFRGIGQRWTSADYTPTFDVDGTVNGWVAIVHDITERKRAEQALRESEERLRLAAEAGRMFAYSWDTASDVIERSGESAEILGLDRGAAATGAAAAAMVHPADKKQFEAALSKLTVEKPFLRLAYRVIRPDGTVIWLERNSRAYFDDHGGIKRMVGMVVDITERKRAEEAIIEGEKRFRLVASTAPVMIWMSGQDRQPTYFNHLWLEFTGQSEMELKNGLPGLLHPEDRQKGIDIYREAFAQRRPFRKECRLRRHDGEYRWMLDIGVPRFHEDGSFAGYIGSCVDITEQKLAEEARSSLSRRLIEAQEEERTWIARELHDDINQRLALLAVNLEGLKEHHPSSNGPVKRRFDEVQKQVQQISSDIEALTHRLHSSRLEYLGLEAASAGFCRELSNLQNVEVDFHSESVPKDLRKEVSLCLFRVLQEALQNAVKHSGARRFQVSLRGGTNEVALTVRDSGVGFDPEQTINGQGLGLTSMKERLRLVDGKLFIDSELQRGTAIQARVPQHGDKWCDLLGSSHERDS
jgi:PAS domain S-box-containing protein